MMARTLQISDSEWDVMEPIWAAGACTAADVIKALRATHDWNHSTIRTLLARLVEKGALAYDVDGSRYIYRAAVTTDEVYTSMTDDIIEQLFEGSLANLVDHFLTTRDVSAEELRRLEQLIAERKKRP